MESNASPNHGPCGHGSPRHPDPEQTLQASPGTSPRKHPLKATNKTVPVRRPYRSGVVSRKMESAFLRLLLVADSVPSVGSDPRGGC